MRNGNNQCSCSLGTQAYSSYRTYEEWKLSIRGEGRGTSDSSYRTYEEWKQGIKWNLSHQHPVLTVPMRNGNAFPNLRISQGVFPFLPYLWGMETWSPSLIGQGQHKVLTVPMRNGNVAFLWVSLAILLGSYRTYEEWKPYSNSSYQSVSIMFLPYLWGMETRFSSPLFSSFPPVLTVPMRNGNILTSHSLKRIDVSSYRTYEEWKRFRTETFLGRVVRFLPYLWGMETVWKNTGWQG